MKKQKAYKMSVVLAALGVILILLPVFGVAAGRQQGLIFAGVVSFVSAAVVRELGK
ncbi:MAG: hypothetical protein GF408_07010 [Candidatus Omnitrophica bacterium]|nr:hypothetical protein [Candidatus Omnitrophota bacterium]